MSQDPSIPDGLYHGRDVHGAFGSLGSVGDFGTVKGDGLRLHPSIPSIPSLQSQKPSNNFNMRNFIHHGAHNLPSTYPDTSAASMYSYYHQQSEPKGAHLYPPRPYASPYNISAFEPTEPVYTTENHSYPKDDSKNLGFATHRAASERQKHSSSVQGVDIKEIEDVDDNNRCKNTVEGTKTSVRRFKKWYKDKTGKSLDMNSLTKQMAVELLKDFFLEIRDTRPGKEGNEYEPVTLTTYRNGLRRYFLERKCPPAVENFDLADREFDVVNYGLVTKRNELKRKGKGNHPNVVESITDEQLARMWATGAIGVHAPRPLLRLQWWINTVCHGIRGRMAHHDLSVDDFRITRAADGKIVIDHVKAGNKRHRIGPDEKDSQRNKKRCKARVVATDGGERDPVRAFEVYLRHRPPSISSFYLTPKHKPKGDIWFNKVPMGKNSIGRIMREIKAIAGIG
ncbi:hypothetical protein QZH41_000947 [Actinostola sp. cb2023]|nr:hypothetical protein QZH41_000947 [Actinostola sp. cb2023]